MFGLYRCSVFDLFKFIVQHLVRLYRKVVFKIELSHKRVASGLPLMSEDIYPLLSYKQLSKRFLEDQINSFSNNAHKSEYILEGMYLSAFL
jgi:hypothetical protein